MQIIAVFFLASAAIGGVVYSVLSIPVQILTGPLQQQWMDRWMSNNPEMTPEMRDFIVRMTASSGARVIGMLISVVIYSVFGLLGGLIGAAVFKRNLPPPPPPGPGAVCPRRRCSGRC